MLLAIDFEADSAAFYRSMRREGLEDEVLGLLRRLERVEREHDRILRDHEADRGGPAVLQFAPELSLSIPTPPAKPDFRALLQVAMAREQSSAPVYRMTADMTLAAFRELPEGLATFEEEHDRKLRRTLEGVTAIEPFRTPGGSG